MAITRLRAKSKPKSPRNSPKPSPKLKAVQYPVSTPSKKAAPSPLKKVSVKEKQVEEKQELQEEEKEEEKEDEIELPSDSDSDSDLEGLEEVEEFKQNRDKIDLDVKKVITHEVKTQLNEAAKEKNNKSKKTGILYVGRLPRGFEEYELKKYFEQFGTILNLRLSRNKKTGNSKHYAFIEFEHLKVAQIAAETMNNYLLFGHIIKVSVLEKSRHDLFKDLNRKFKVIPWAKIGQLQNDKPRSLAKWTTAQSKHTLKQQKQLARLKLLGILYSL